MQASNDACGVADSQRIGWDVLGDDAASTYCGVMAYVNTGQNEHARADPHVVFYDDGRRRWQRVMLPQVVLVIVEDECVMTEETVATNTHELVR